MRPAGISKPAGTTADIDPTRPWSSAATEFAKGVEVTEVEAIPAELLEFFEAAQLASKKN